MRHLLAMVFVLLASPSWAATYYMSPSGSNANDGLTASTPWLTFAYAINASRAWCGDTLILRDGTYQAGTTGVILISNVVCTAGDELTLRAENQRKAKILSDGSSAAVGITGSSYIIIDGLYGRGTDNSGSTAGMIFRSYLGSSNIIFRNLVARNPNRYANAHVFSAESATNVLFEDSEGYVFHRHCVHGYRSSNVVARRVYCNPREGAIPGGFGAGAGLGRADSAFSMYPCHDCIAENVIADGTTSPMYLNEMNATFSASVLMSGSQVLGSICYKCNYGNGIYLNSRNAVGLNYTPQNITIRDVAFIDYDSISYAIRVSDGVNITVDRITVLSTAGSGATSQRGINTGDNPGLGVDSTQNSIMITNFQASGLAGTGFLISGFNTWTGNEVISYNNATAFNPTPPSNWTNTSTSNPQMGTCKLWVPDGAAAKGSGVGGADIGATILYQYVNGVLTSTPLWNPTTGVFPHGADDLDGTNNVVGESLQDFHTRVNVNTGGCSFPAGYGGGGGGGSSTVVRGSTAASPLTATATPLIWDMTISPNQDRLLVCVGTWSSTAGVGIVSSIDVSGQAMTWVASQVTIPDSYRAVEMWTLANPTAGLRTITVNLAGTISGAVGRAIEFDHVSGLNTPFGVSTFGAATSLSGTAATNTNERVEDCTVSSKSVTYTHGADQIGDTDLDHDTQSLRLATSTQSGASGGVMSNSTGGASYQAKVMVSLLASPEDPPSTATLTQSDYLLIYPYGTEADAPPVKWWLSDASAKNAAIVVHPDALVRVRGLIVGSVATTSPFGAALYCRKDAESYTKVMNDAGATMFRLYGASANSDIPSNLTPTSNRICASSCVPGAMLRDQSAVFTVPALTVGQKIELDAVVQLVGASGTVNCRFQSDNGTTLDAYTNTATMTVVPVATGTP